MPSFLIRGLAKFFAASSMASSSNSSSSSSSVGEGISKGINVWNKNMQWLIPFTQATDYRIVIENPKSHEKIVIDKDTKELPRLTSEWLNRYNKQEVIDWMSKKKEQEQARQITEAHGRAKFGNSYTPTEQEISKVLQDTNNH